MTLSLTIIMSIIVVLLIGKFDLKWFHALLCVLCGLTLGGTEVGQFLLEGLETVATALAQVKF
ncbi:hypothetical protein SEA_ANNADREAMY_192 [Streptomyces phage Annadreamy]|uniref:Uncharacterized protein n=2 Tax=Annadreamyvirus annadreamy TaxID=2846392 RepID=A0A345GTK5_9CAUD|nr:hypothetical protein HWB75_gp086 [Streptomyces phage Annadreamy]AXG66277.1 hypothetical protein SEA_ANNADREAMY_192 [Streptomyces phage Annadreamy]QGH79500.1 hypothetical protein SEA_LIMPID_199 [Streptomyces phage Limpid]